jgi:HAD domain in Swiss Army Knife RNA repair proteins
MILFLDFDGVLHPDAAFLDKGRPVLRAEGELFMWTPHLVEALAPHPHIRIVLSTSWVRVRGFNRARNALPEPLRKRVIGATWHTAIGQNDESYYWWTNASRYQQIVHYVERARLERRIAIDDDDEEWAGSARGRLILTNPGTGISDPLILEQLRKLLKSKSES